MKYETKAIHAGKREKENVKGVNVPIHLSSTFVQEGLNEYGEFVYTRGNNPTRQYVESLVAELEGAKYGLALSSGMAATSLVFGLFEKGDKILFNSSVYGGTYRYFSNVFKNRGLEYDIIQDFNTLIAENIDSSVKAIFIETPTNPLLEVIDIQRLAGVAHQKNVLLIVDNTFLTSYFQKPLDLGADIVVYSATKYYSGHSDVLAGFVTLNNDFIYENLKFLQNTFGSILSPFDSYLIARGIKTLPLRMNKHQENALAIAKYLDEHPKVKKVNYPGLSTHKNYQVQRKQSKGDGAVLSFVLKDGTNVNQFIDALNIIDLAVSLGGVESLICHPATMTHESYPKEIQKEVGIEERLLRLSIGVENIEDLLSDIERALNKA